MHTARRNQRRYTNAALTVIAALLGLNALSNSDLLAPSAAHAQSGEDGLVSAAEQRKVMIAELRNLSSRIERLETTIARGVNVKVTDMPAVRLADPSQMSDARESRESRDSRDTRKSR